MALSSSALRRLDPFVTVASGTLTALQAVQALGLEVTATGTGEAVVEAHAVTVLRGHLAPLSDETLRTRLQMPDQARTDLPIFLQGEVPSLSLLEAIHGNPTHWNTVVFSTVTPTPAPPTSVDPLAYPGRRTAQRLTEEAPRVLAAVERLIEGAQERGGVASAPVPAAISLEHVLANPDLYRDKPLEIVLFDVDDTTRRGQMWIEWLLLDVLRYGPKNSTGLGFGSLIKTLWRSFFLRNEESSDEGEGVADEKKTHQTIREGIKGLSLKRVTASFERFYEAMGNRNISPYMRDELAHHHVKGRLIIGISASPLNLVQRHAEDIGIPVGNVFGTSVKFDDKGIATGEYTLLRSGEKVKHLEANLLAPLRERNIAFKIVAGYSDSDSDMPMFDLVREHGGAVIATNAPREAFDKKVLKMGGQVVHETSGWPGEEGERQTTIFSMKDAGTLAHSIPVPSRKPAILADVKDYVVVAGMAAAGMVVAEPLSNAAIKGVGSLYPDDFFDTGSVVASAVSAGLSYFFLPKSGHVTGFRRWVLQDMAPLTSAMYYASGRGEFSPAAFFLSAMAATVVTRTAMSTIAWTSQKAGWRGLERFSRGKLQDLVTRPAQTTLFRILYPILRAYEQRHGINLS